MFLFVIVWDEWIEWSSCSANCGGGNQERKRACKTVACKGFAKESRNCNTAPCGDNQTSPDTDENGRHLTHILWSFNYIDVTCICSSFWVVVCHKVDTPGSLNLYHCVTEISKFEYLQWISSTMHYIWLIFFFTVEECRDLTPTCKTINKIEKCKETIWTLMCKETCGLCSGTTGLYFNFFFYASKVFFYQLRWHYY